jgi:hypothetical protein
MLRAAARLDEAKQRAAEPDAAVLTGGPGSWKICRAKAADGQRGEDTICKVPEGEFTFLAYSFGRMYSAKTGKAYLG